MTEFLFFHVDGYKISGMVLSEDAFLFSSNSSNSAGDFMEAYTKKLSLATKTKVKYETVSSITKEEKSDTIVINYKGAIGVPATVEFSFINPSDTDEFFDYLTAKLYYTKSTQTLTPFKAIRGQLFGALVTLAFTIFCVWLANDIENGTTEEPTRAKSKLFYALLGFLGPFGTLIIGIAITSFIVYKAYSRVKTPPNQVKLTPPTLV